MILGKLIRRSRELRKPPVHSLFCKSHISAPIESPANRVYGSTSLDLLLVSFNFALPFRDSVGANPPFLVGCTFFSNCPISEGNKCWCRRRLDILHRTRHQARGTSLTYYVCWFLCQNKLLEQLQVSFYFWISYGQGLTGRSLSVARRK